MKSQPSNIIRRAIVLSTLIAVSFLSAAAQVKAPPMRSSSAAPAKQKTFATPELAAQALIKAAESNDVPALLQLFGPEGKDLVTTADPVRDKEKIEEFVAKAREKNSVNVNKTQATLLIGNDEWPVPVPIVKRQGTWSFDTKAGHDEILFRRIGSNELDAIRICRGFVDAQKQYASTVHDDSGVHQYAQKIISTPGKQDGLFWRNADGSAGGPVSEVVAHAIEEGYSEKSRTPYHGYYFKVLKGQGPAAPLGELDYMVKGMMIGGFALVAVPAEYRVTGVKSFIVSHDGIVYEKDLGPDSVKLVKAMERYNPDRSWRATNDEM
jgi:Protein of unknown function (DUF2950)